MPRLKFGFQKLVNQWVNVNKEHVVFNSNGRSSPNGGRGETMNLSPRFKSHGPPISNHFDDDGATIITASTADATSSVSTHSTGLSRIQKQVKVNGTNWARNQTRIKSTSNSSSISMENLSFVRRIEDRSFGPSYIGKWKRNCNNSENDVNDDTKDALDEDGDERVSIHVISSYTSRDKLAQELSVLKSLSPHSNITQFFGCTTISAEECDSRKIYGILFQLGHNTSNLTDWLYLMASSPIASKPRNFYWDILGGVINGLNHLHSNGIVHGCLQPENILVNDVHRDEHGNIQMDVKISDFGLMNVLNLHCSRENMEEDVLFYRLCNRYTAPEHIRSHAERKHRNINFISKSDIYSFGMMSWHMITHEIPFSSQVADEEVFDSICNDIIDRNGRKTSPRPSFPENIPKFLKLLIEQCWTEDPEERPSSYDINEHILQELQNKLLSDQDLMWIGDLKGHQAYFDECNNEKYIEIPHRKMSKLSVEDTAPGDSIEHEAFLATSFAKRNLDIDVSILTKSQRRGLMRIKRPKFTKNKKSKSPNINKEDLDTCPPGVYEDTSSPSSRRFGVSKVHNICEIEPDVCEKNIPFAPVLMPAGANILNARGHVMSSAIPLFQPFFPNPATLPHKMEVQKPGMMGKDPMSYKIDSNTLATASKRILHFNHAAKVDIELKTEIRNNQGLDKQILIQDLTTDTSSPMSIESDISEDHIRPPDNSNSVFRRLNVDEEKMDSGESDFYKARMDAIEVLTSQFSPAQVGGNH